MSGKLTQKMSALNAAVKRNNWLWVFRTPKDYATTAFDTYMMS